MPMLIKSKSRSYAETNHIKGTYPAATEKVEKGPTADATDAPQP
jgi:hypothetical protein